ncbi:hypothetical protein [Paenibacillus sp. WLX2291]|uniref:hypothetical protein n=1 Tax=Paenibacillus sp. WLX2291 TaxID=3296934 RepID=UPI00398404C8
MCTLILLILPFFYWLFIKYHQRLLRENLKTAQVLVEKGILSVNDELVAAYSNLSGHRYENEAYSDDDIEDLRPGGMNGSFTSPLHFLVLTPFELIMGTQRQGEDFAFTTMLLQDIRQLYVSTNSMKQFDSFKENNQLIVIGNGNYRQYHFEFSDGMGTTIRPFVQQLLIQMDHAHLRQNPGFIPSIRKHPAYVPFEQIPLLSTTDEVYLPFMK